MFGKRLLKEVKKSRKSIAPQKGHMKIVAPPDRRYSTWIGGSILANLATFPNMWCSYSRYMEEGMAAVHKTFFSA